MLFEIFTDGSSIIEKDYKASSAAYSIYLYNRPIISDGSFLDGGTNNSGEVSAVLYALRDFSKRVKKVKSNKLKPPYKIHIYTDSMLTRDGCKKWIYDWIKNKKDGIMYTKSGTPVANQNVYLAIYNEFLTNPSYEIEFLHLNSHCIEAAMYRDNVKLIEKYIADNKSCTLPDKLFKYSKFVKAKDKYKEANKRQIGNEELLRLLLFNMRVDDLASEILSEGLEKRNRDIIRKQLG